MNKICSLIRDLFPLYNEDLVSVETKDFIDGHLEECGECSIYYEENSKIDYKSSDKSDDKSNAKSSENSIGDKTNLNEYILPVMDEKNDEIELITQDSILKSSEEDRKVILDFNKKIKKQNRVQLSLIIFLSLFVFTVCMSFLTKPIFNNVEKENYRVQELKDTVVIYLDQKHVDSELIETPLLLNNSRVGYIKAYTTLLDKMISREHPTATELQKKDFDSIYAYSPKHGFLLLYGKEGATNLNNVFHETNRFIVFYSVLIFIFFIITIYQLIRGFNNKSLLNTWFLLISIMISKVLVVGFLYKNIKETREIIFFILTTLFLFLSIKAGIEFYKFKKEDKVFII